MTLPQPGTKGTITAGPSKGQHGAVIDSQGYWVRTDAGKTVGPFYRESSFKPDSLWRSDFTAGGFGEWTYEGTAAQPTMWPQSPPISVSGGMARFEVSPTDAAAGRIHAKVYKDLPWQPIRLTARMMLDAGYRQPSWDAPAIIFQVKEHHGPAGDSDPRLWVAALPDAAPLQRFALNGGVRAHWVNPFAVPRGEWFTLALEFRPNVGAKLLLNGAQVATAAQLDTIALHPDARLTFGVGTYGKALGAAWCDWAMAEAIAGGGDD